VAGPDRYSLADAPASDRPTRDGDIMFLDGGAAGDGYISDIIRLLAFGEISSEQAHYADLAASATRAMIGAAVPGTPVTEVYQAGQSVYVDAGIGDRSGAIFGHGIGLELWERPFIKVHDDPNENIRLRPGMTVCLEPILVPVTDSGEIVGIFVFEQQVAVTNSGNEVLSAGVEQELFRVSQHK
jgi:Xaa-Pro aminopeptidase